MKDTVYMITELDGENGFARDRRIFILEDSDNFANVFAKIVTDKNIRGMYTTNRKVLLS